MQRYLRPLVLGIITLLAIFGIASMPTAGAHSSERAYAVTPTPTPKPKKPLNPVRMRIDAIKLDRKLVSVGLDKNNIPIVPNHDIGWYNLSSTPGQGENIVFWGHVLRFRQAPKLAAPFEKIDTLAIGDEIVLYDAKGTSYRYAITEQLQVTPDQVEYILPTGSERITMVSCYGSKVISKGEVVDMSHRRITIAEPIP
jgi:sortase (surface protein transpeptidase)